MQVTKKTGDPKNKLTVDIAELQELCGCGRKTAYDIGIQADAVIRIGRRVLFSVPKIEKYLESITSE